MKYLNVILVSLLLLSGCDEESVSYSNHNDYLPLHVGNRWKFKYTHLPENTGYLFKEVTGVITINDQQYYVVESGSANPEEVVDHVTYYRITRQGYVYIMNENDTKEENQFRLNGDHGDNWSYQNEGDDEVSIQLSEVTVQLGNTTLEHCKLYSYDVLQWADEETNTTFARGIGFVKMSGSWGFETELTSAIIDGEEVDF